MSARTRSALATAGAALAVLAVLTVAGRALLADVSVPAACDNLYKLGHQEAFTRAMDAGRDPTGWYWEFEGGFAELQFYPPGAAGLGWLFHSLFQVSSATAYWMVLVFAWYLPGVAAFVTLRIAAASRIASVLGGVVTGTVVFGHAGTFAGVGCGVLAVRLSLGTFLLAVGLFIGAMRPHSRRRGRLPWLLGTAAAVAAASTFHLYFVPFFFAIVAWWTAVTWRRRPERGTRPPLGPALAAGAGLALAGIWWSGTVLVRADSVPYRASAENVALSFLVRPESEAGLDWLILLAGFAASLWTARRVRNDDATMLLFAVVPVVAVEALVIVLDRLAGVPFFPANRTYDFVIFWVAMTAPVGLDRLRARGIEPARIALVAACAGAVWLVLESPTLLPSTIGRRMPAYGATGPDQLWAELARGSGRLVFTNNWYDGSFFPGYTPFVTDRDAVNGGPIHPSPMQANLMSGPGSDVIESFDYHGNTAMFGVSWADAARSPEVLEDLHGRLVELGITQLVVNPVPGDGAVTAAIVESAPTRFRRAAATPGFVVFDVLGARPERADVADGAGDLYVTESGLDIDVRAVTTSPATVRVHAYAGAYWRTLVDGQEVVPERDRWGQMLLRLDEPGTHQIEVLGQTPPVLRVARPACAVAGLALLAVAISLPRRRPERDPAQLREP